MAYKVHTVCKRLPGKYPKLFARATAHKGGTATLRLATNPNLPLLMAVNHYLEEESIYVVHFQIIHNPKTIKYGRVYSILHENLFHILKDRQRFIPDDLPFDDPITADEAAELIGVHIQYARRLAKTSIFEAKKMTGVWYVSQDSVVEYRRQRIRDILYYEYGTGAAQIIESYLSVTSRLPLTKHTAEPIIAAFELWIDELESENKLEATWHSE